MTIGMHFDAILKYDDLLDAMFISHMQLKMYASQNACLGRHCIRPTGTPQDFSRRTRHSVECFEKNVQ